MDAETPVKGIYNKLHAIMSEVGFITKDKRNEIQKYNYASEQAIKERMHPLLTKYRVLLIPDSIELLAMDHVAESKQRVTTLKIKYHFYDVDSGESAPGEMLGSGADSMDKGVFKALTGALKYIFTTTFVIPTGDDPEGESGKQRGGVPQRRSTEAVDGQPQPRRGDPNAKITEPQQKRIFGLMSKAGKTPVQVKEIIKAHGFDHSADITVGKYDAICTEVERT